MKKLFVFRHMAVALIMLMLLNVQVFAADNLQFTYDESNTSYAMSPVSEAVYGVEDYTAPNYNINSISAIDGTVSEIVYQVRGYYKDNKPTLENWEEIVALKLAGENLKTSPWSLISWDQESIDSDSQATAYAGRILALLALDENPSSYGGRNFLQELSNKQQINGSFGGSINNTIWAIIALDEAGASYDKVKAIEYLISQKKSDGGFAISGTLGDPDVTAEALLALSKHKDKIGVNTAIQGAINFLKSAQQESAGFQSWGSENSQSSARVISGLLAVGENVIGEAWQKEGKTIIDALLAYLLPDNSFQFSTSGSTNPMATRQALRALAELERAGYGTYKPGSGSGGATPEEPNTATVRVRVEGIANSLADETVTVKGTAWDALIAAVGSENVVAPGGFISTIKGEGSMVVSDTITFWMYYVVRNGQIEEGSFSQESNSYHVKNGDEIVFYIGAFDSSWNSKTYFPIVSISPASPAAGQSVTIHISEKKYTWPEGLQDLTGEEKAAIGNYIVKVGDAEYTSQGGKVTIPSVQAGTLKYMVRNQNEAGYPDVVTYKGSINVTAGGGSVTPNEITVFVEIIGKNNRTHYSGYVALPKSKANAFEALKATGISYQAKDNNSYVFEIAGEKEDKTSTAGWKYKVGSSIPGVPAIDYTLNDADSVLWFWAGDYTATGPGGGMPLVPGAIALNKEVEQSIADAVKKLEEALKNKILAKNTPITQLQSPSIVIGKDSPMTESQKKALQSLLEKNHVSMGQKVEVGKESILTDPLNEIVLKIGKDAINREVEITAVEIEKDKKIVVPETHKLLSSLYAFGPKGTTFSKPVYMSIRTVIPEGLQQEDIVLAWYDEEKNKWIATATVVDAATGTVIGLVEHFTKFAVLVKASVEELQIEQEGRISVSFEDVNEKNYPWAVKEISYLASKGIITGVGGNRFEPAREITRAEFTALLVKMMGLDPASEYQGQFKDVGKEDWYAGYIQAAVEAGIITGLSENRFGPSDKLTREQAAVMTAKLSGEKKPVRTMTFKDEDQISPWAINPVLQTANSGIFNGFPDGTFRPKGYVTRAQSGVIIYRLMVE